MNPTTSERIELPYQLRRAIERVEPTIRKTLRQIVVEKVQQLGHTGLTWEQLNDCINDALRVMVGDTQTAPQADPRIVRLSRESFKRGEAITTEEFLNEIKRGALAHPNAA